MQVEFGEKDFFTFCDFLKSTELNMYNCSNEAKGQSSHQDGDGGRGINCYESNNLREGFETTPLKSKDDWVSELESFNSKTHTESFNGLFMTT